MQGTESEVVADTNSATDHISTPNVQPGVSSANADCCLHTNVMYDDINGDEPVDLTVDVPHTSNVILVDEQSTKPLANAHDSYSATQSSYE